MEAISLEKFTAPDIPLTIGKKSYILTQPSMKSYIEIATMDEKETAKLTAMQQEDKIRSRIVSMLKNKGLFGRRQRAFKRIVRRFYGVYLMKLREELFLELGWSLQATQKNTSRPDSQETTSGG